MHDSMVRRESMAVWRIVSLVLGDVTVFLVTNFGFGLSGGINWNSSRGGERVEICAGVGRLSSRYVDDDVSVNQRGI